MWSPRRFRPQSGFALAMTAAGLAGCGNAAAEPMRARWAVDFVDSAGVNTHFADASSGYRQRAKLLVQRLLQAHLRHVRDGGLDDRGGIAADDGAPEFRRLAQAGIGVDFIIRAGVDRAFLRDFPAHVGRSVETYELPNEVNQGGDPNWAPALRVWSARFKSLVAQSAAPVPILGAALAVLDTRNPYAALGNISADVDFGNVHDYVAGRDPATPGWGGAGLPPCRETRVASLGFATCYAAAAYAGRQLVSTETGWGTGSNQPTDVPEAVQAAYVLRSLLVHFAAGFARTYLYELKDTGADAFAHYGLLRRDGTPKPAFLAVAGLLGVLDGKRGPGSAGQADVMVAAPSGSRIGSVLLRRDDAMFVLALWDDEPLVAFSPTDGASLLPGLPRQVRLRIAGLASVKSLCQPGASRCPPLRRDGAWVSVAVDPDAPSLVAFSLMP